MISNHRALQTRTSKNIIEIITNKLFKLNKMFYNNNIRRIMLSKSHLIGKRLQNNGVFQLQKIQWNAAKAQSTAAATAAEVTSAESIENATAAKLDTSYVQKLQAEWSTAKPFKDIPGPTRYEMWRGFLKGGDFAKLSFEDVMRICRERYGDTYLLPGLFGMSSKLITFSVPSFEKIFRTEGVWPERTGAEAMMHYRNSRSFYKDCVGLLANGEAWGKMRTASNPVLMQHRNAALYLGPMQQVNAEFMQRIRDIRDPNSLEVPSDFLNEINHLSFESVVVVAIDKQFGIIRNPDAVPDAKLLFKNIEIFMQSFFELGIKPSFYKYIRTPTYRRFERAMDDMFDITSRYVNETLERIAQKPDNAAPNSVLEQLLKVNKKFAIVLAMDLMISAVDTTSSVLAGVLLNLAKNPEKQAKLRAEILATLPTLDANFTLSSMKSLPYLRACIKESLRLYPIVFGNNRTTGIDLVLDGYRVPQGTHVLMNSNMLLREEQYYPRALEFIPERWLRQSEPNATTTTNELIADNLSPFIYLPFGFGPRMCLGKRIVDMELELTVSNIVRNFHMEFNYPTENAFECSFINKPAIPLKFKFTDIKY